MRHVLLGSAVLLASLAAQSQPSRAQSEYTNPWCIEGKGGGMDCSFHTFEQCRVTRQGQGGSCVRNPFASREYRSGSRSRSRDRDRGRDY